MNEYDLIIVGAGPAGQSLAARLAQAPLRIALIDKESKATLAAPAYDGREIALTQTSIARLKQLGAWARLAEREVAPLARAEVMNGQSPYVLSFADQSGEDALGALAPNSAIRRALFQTIAGQENCDLRTGHAATIEAIDAKGAQVRLADGAILNGKMVVAADTRFSLMRKSQGISAHMLDFGRTMLVCRVQHAKPHQGVATEWFGHGQTIAMLPLHGDQSSFVLTLKAHAMQSVMALSDVDFARDIERRTQARWGEITLTSTRHAYPLVAVYASRFVGRRFALVGDAAVGMHPVTAHGFNFGLRSAYALGDEIMRALKAGRDIADPRGFARYERTHRRATLPLYAATNAIAQLYSDERPIARVARTAGLHLMNVTPGARRLVEASLRH
jgi:ubiquinone biosynthesis UbiH/UbiF/VisC/COQ6 family hydroxylase